MSKALGNSFRLLGVCNALRTMAEVCSSFVFPETLDDATADRHHLEAVPNSGPLIGSSWGRLAEGLPLWRAISDKGGSLLCLF